MEKERLRLSRPGEPIAGKLAAGMADSSEEEKEVVAEDLFFSLVGYRLLLIANRRDGVPLKALTPSVLLAAAELVAMGLAFKEGDRLMATPRGRLVSRAQFEVEELTDHVAVRIRSGSLWSSELSEQWAAADVVCLRR